ncbi:PAS domain S-box protein (plasmid) [Deinococcus sp. KNUC1210]|uniref:PAS domain S-box protein n=1 Tax=Deinococcus sp. KNUC1210 TaxID=2917691 RepID=UPI001EF0150E|nr:PAS domain S-box protein [Deinococcus sp. KNUC1210]ULH17742.1 PAS domain S-box protein [Deinococcus sp. KNUC1210]
MNGLAPPAAPPKFRFRALTALIVLVLAAFLTAAVRLNRATELSSVSLTGWAFSELVRQVAVTSVSAARDSSDAVLNDDIAVLQSKAEIVSNDLFVDKLDDESAAALSRALKTAAALNVAQLRGPAGTVRLQKLLDDAQNAYAGAVAALSSQRAQLARDLNLVEVILSVLALLLALSAGLVLRRFQHDAAHAVALEADRTREAQQYAARLHQLYEVTSAPEPDQDTQIQQLLNVGMDTFDASAGIFACYQEGKLQPVAVAGEAQQQTDLLLKSAALSTGEMRSLIVPVALGGQRHGVLAYSRRDGTPALHSEQAFLRLMAQWLGQMLEQRRAELQLRESEARSQAIIRSSLDAIITSDDAGRVTEFNPAAERIFAISRNHALGRMLSELIIPPDMRADHQRGMERLRTDGRGRILGQRLELTAQRADGAHFPVELSVVRLPVTPALYTGFVRDITDRTAAERRLQERTQQLDSVFRVSPDGFVMFDHQQRVVDVNPAFLEMTGLSRAALLGQSEPDVTASLARLSDPAQPFPSTFTHDTFDVLALVRPTPRVLKRSVRRLDDQSDLSGYVMYFRDVTHETEVSNMKTEFLSTAAHELRTPMASIYGFAELLHSQELDPATSREMAEIIYRQAERLVQLLNELLDLARIEARAGKDFRIIEQPLSPLIEHTLEAFVPPGQRNRVQVQIDPALPTVAVDGNKLQQALGNLISNAFKYSPADAPVIINACVQGTEVNVSVRDHGIGMRADQLARAFERFYRADSSGSIPGTGLGLSLVREIVDRHGGLIHLESSVGEGTLATLTLPLPGVHL